MPGMCALVRQLCLRVLDKADQRAAAVASVRELVRAHGPVQVSVKDEADCVGQTAVCS
jgi:hypothetical protein